MISFVVPIGFAATDQVRADLLLTLHKSLYSLQYLAIPQPVLSAEEPSRPLQPSTNLSLASASFQSVDSRVSEALTHATLATAKPAKIGLRLQGSPAQAERARYAASIIVTTHRH